MCLKCCAWYLETRINASAERKKRRLINLPQRGALKQVALA